MLFFLIYDGWSSSGPMPGQAASSRCRARSQQPMVGAGSSMSVGASEVIVRFHISRSPSRPADGGKCLEPRRGCMLGGPYSVLVTAWSLRILSRPCISPGRACMLALCSACTGVPASHASAQPETRSAACGTVRGSDARSDLGAGRTSSGPSRPTSMASVMQEEVIEQDAAVNKHLAVQKRKRK